MLEQENFGFIQEVLGEFSLTVNDLFLIERDAIIEYESYDNEESRSPQTLSSALS
jgi:hypothetical protein